MEENATDTALARVCRLLGIRHSPTNSGFLSEVNFVAADAPEIVGNDRDEMRQVPGESRRKAGRRSPGKMRQKLQWAGWRSRCSMKKWSRVQSGSKQARGACQFLRGSKPARAEWTFIRKGSLSWLSSPEIPAGYPIWADSQFA